MGPVYFVYYQLYNLILYIFIKHILKEELITRLFIILHAKPIFTITFNLIKHFIRLFNPIHD